MGLMCLLKKSFSWRSTVLWCVYTPIWLGIIILSCVITGLRWGDSCLKSDYTFTEWLAANAILAFIAWIIDTPLSMLYRHRNIRIARFTTGLCTLIVHVPMSIIGLVIFLVDTIDCAGGNALWITGLIVIVFQLAVSTPIISIATIGSGIEIWRPKIIEHLAAKYKGIELL